MTQARLARILLYARNIEKSGAYYVTHFGFTMTRDDDGQIVELTGSNGLRIMIHQAAVSQRPQSVVKLVFDVADVTGFVAAHPQLKFGAVHQADGYAFADCKDPDGNPVQVSSRGFRR
jgi:catechol 2,3-dioxygenase-like lactoylglutathione lyase family enzyme